MSFEIGGGEIVAILGASGCGKTTLLNHMVGLNKPYAGRILIDGDNVNSDDDRIVRRALKKIGILSQGSALLCSMTVADNIALPILEYTAICLSAVRRLVRMKLRQADLEGYGKHLPSELSGGMKKRAGLARAMALNPKILFLDEPSAGLDPVISAEIDELILRINRTSSTTMVIVTHELASIFTVAARVIMLDREIKGILAAGDPHEL